MQPTIVCGVDTLKKIWVDAANACFNILQYGVDTLKNESRYIMRVRG